jgi:Zn-dependent M28 family amino/carboxypeptidase
VLELARLFKAGPPPERSVWFIGFTAEEKGLLGSEYYSAHPLTPLATTVALLNLDVMNVEGLARDLSTQGKGDDSLDAIAARYVQAKGRRYTHDSHLEEGSFYRADHFSLAKAGVPAVTLTAGLDLVIGGTAAGAVAHRDWLAHRYHQPAGEWRADWDLTGAVADLEVYGALGGHLANSRDWPEWPAASEFKSARDATAMLRAPQEIEAEQARPENQPRRADAPAPRRQLAIRSRVKLSTASASGLRPK